MKALQQARRCNMHVALITVVADCFGLADRFPLCSLGPHNNNALKRQLLRSVLELSSAPVHQFGSFQHTQKTR